MAEFDARAVGAVNAGIRFLLELLALGLFGYWGYSIGGTGGERIALAVGLPLVVAAVWGTFGSPAAPYRLPQPWRLGLETVVFGGAVIASDALWGPAVAVGFGVVVAVNAALFHRSAYDE